MRLIEESTSASCQVPHNKADCCESRRVVASNEKGRETPAFFVFQSLLRDAVEYRGQLRVIANEADFYPVAEFDRLGDLAGGGRLLDQHREGVVRIGHGKDGHQQVATGLVIGRVQPNGFGSRIAGIEISRRTGRGDFERAEGGLAEV